MSERAAGGDWRSFALLWIGQVVSIFGSGLTGFGLVSGVSPGGEDVVVRLAPGGRVRVTARRADGSPVGGAFASVDRVNGVRAGFMAGGRTADDGTVEFDLPAGAVEIVARKDLNLSGRGVVTVAPGGVAALEITLAEVPPAP
jgi:hypothetical protein